MLITVQGSRDVAVISDEAACDSVTIIGLIDGDQFGLGVSALVAGARALATLQDDPLEIARCVAAALRSQSIIPAGVLSLIVAGLRPVAAASRVQEVNWLKAIASGTTVSALAETVAYSEREIYRRLRNLYSELGVSRRTEAISIAIRQGLI